MAIRSVYEVDVDDAKFQNFAKMFDKYKSMLDKSGGDWNKTNKSVDGVTKSLTAAILAQTEMLGSLIKGEKELEQRSARTANSWRDLARSTKNVASQIKDATSGLLKWASVGGVISGLVGAGGLFGLDSLANGVGNTRRSSLGLGTTYGEKKAFDLNFGRVVDSDAFLGNVNASLHDVTKRGALYAAGLGENALKGDTAQVSIALLGQLKRIADSTDPRLLGQTLQARRLDQFISLEDFERLRNTPQSELAGYAKSFGKDAKTLGLDQGSQRAWQDFIVQLNRAGEQIENIFVTKLTRLVGPLDKFSDSIVKSFSSFVNNPDFDKGIKAFADGIEGAARYIGGKDFQDGLKEFAADVVLVAKALVHALQWLNIIPKSAEEKKAEATAANWKNLNARTQMLDTFSRIIPGINPISNDLLAGIAKTESGNKKHPLGDPNAIGPMTSYGWRAKGMYQLSPDLSKGINPFNEDQAKEVARKELFRLFRHYGDVEKTIAGYNWGQGRLDRDITRHGDQWKKFLPKETAAYIVKVENNTGGNAIVTTSQLPQ